MARVWLGNCRRAKLPVIHRSVSRIQIYWPVRRSWWFKVAGTLLPPPLWLVATNRNCGLNCDTTPDFHLRMLSPTTSPPHTTLLPPTNTTQPRQCSLPWTRKRAEGDCGQWGRVPITSIPHSYEAVHSTHTFPSSSLQIGVPSMRSEAVWYPTCHLICTFPFPETAPEYRALPKIL